MAEDMGFEEFKGTGYDEEGEEQKHTEPKKEEKRTIIRQGAPPSLDKLLYSLEAANSHPSYALDHLKELAEDVDKVVELLHMVDENFAPDKDITEIQDNIYSFMQNSILLIDNH